MNSGSFDDGLLNLTNWIGNVIMPTLTVLFLVMAIHHFSKGRDASRHVAGAMAALCVSGLLRLAEVFTQQATGADQYYTAILTLVNWVGNVLMPVYAGLEVTQAFLALVVKNQIMAREKTFRHIATAGACLSVSAITRLLEYFIVNGKQIGG